MDIDGKSEIKNKGNFHLINKDHPPIYKTSDLYLGAFLKTRGVCLQTAPWEKGRVVFIFQDPGNIQELIAEYFNDSTVGVLAYKAALRDLRTIIFEYKDRKGQREE